MKSHDLEKQLPVSHQEEVWEQRFEQGVWSTFLNTNKILLIYVVLHTFSHFFLGV